MLFRHDSRIFGGRFLCCADQSLLRLHEFDLCIRWGIRLHGAQIHMLEYAAQDLVMLFLTCLFRVPSKLSLSFSLSAV